MPRCRRPTAASARSPGSRCSPARRPRTSSTTGCRTTPIEAFKEFLVGIKGPLTTPVGGGIRSLNVALRQMLDLYVCLRPVQYFQGVPSPVKHPEKVNMVIFRENTEDIYAGIDYQAGSPEAKKILEFLQRELPAAFKKIRFGKEAADQIGIGIKPVSKPGTERLVRAALEYAIAAQAQERDDRPQGQHHEVHRRRVPRLGLRAGQARVRRGGNRRRPVVQDCRRASSSRTPSPTSRSSRCSRGRRIST